MTTLSDIREIAEKAVSDTDAFVVDVTMSPDQDIVVELDSPTGVDLDFCEHVSRLISNAIPDDEDYSLEVGSSSLSAPFKVRAQYDKHVGDPVEVLTADGRKLRGELKDADDEGFSLRMAVKEKVEGKKRPQLVEKDIRLTYPEVKSVCYWFKN